MKNLLFIIALLSFPVKAWSISATKVTTIYIENRSSKRLGIQAEITPDFVFPRYRTENIYDTLYFYTEAPFRLVCDNIDSSRRYLYTTYLLQPGETVWLKNEPGKTWAYSSDTLRNNELNFFVDMQKETGNFEGFMSYIPYKRKNTDSLFNAVTRLYKKRFDFLERYIVSHPVSAGYEHWLRETLTFRQYFDFLQNYTREAELNRNLLPNADITGFLDPLLLIEDHPASIYYLESLSLLLQLYELKDISYQVFYQKIKDSYKGKTRDYLLFKTLEVAYKSPQIGQLVDDYLATSESDILKERVTIDYDDHIGSAMAEELIIPKPDYNLETTSLLYHLKTGKIINWDTLLAAKGYKYIDFWATWCGGCRANLPHSRQLAKEYGSRGLNVIYISMDENPKLWQKVSRKEQLPDENSYLLLDPRKTFIYTQYRITPIPRYMLVNNEGFITHPNAPELMPSGYSNLESTLEELLK